MILRPSKINKKKSISKESESAKKSTKDAPIQKFEKDEEKKDELVGSLRE